MPLYLAVHHSRNKAVCPVQCRHLHHLSLQHQWWKSWSFRSGWRIELRKCLMSGTQPKAPPAWKRSFMAFRLRKKRWFFFVSSSWTERMETQKCYMRGTSKLRWRHNNQQSLHRLIQGERLSMEPLFALNWLLGAFVTSTTSKVNRRWNSRAVAVDEIGKLRDDKLLAIEGTTNHTPGWRAFILRLYPPRQARLHDQNTDQWNR